jgi:hypothetical protein
VATTVARLEAILSADTGRFNRDMAQAESRTHKTGAAFGKFGKAAVLAGGAAGVGALAYGLKIGIGEFMQGQKVAAQTNAVLKSTGSIAHVTAEHVDELAKAEMLKSGVDDEVIKTGENMLLTFKNIRNEAGKGNKIFDQSVRVLDDMTVALGSDPQKQAIQLGKALNDPIKGITALARVGVTFTDQQKKTIKSLVESGKTMEAQKLILRELNSEFGGSAKAAGETLGGQINILRERFNNWAGDMVGKAIPNIKQFVHDVTPAFNQFVAFVNGQVITAVQQFIGFVRDHMPEIKLQVQQMWAAVKPVLQNFAEFTATVVGLIRKHWGTIGPILAQVANVIKIILGQINNIIRLFTAILKGDWSGAWNAVKDIARNALKLVKELIVLWKDIILEAAKHLGAAIWQGIKAGLAAGEKELKAAVVGLFHKVIDWVKDALGISSPSAVFHEIGVNMIKGMMNGIGSMGGYLKNAVLKLAKSIPSKIIGAVMPGGGSGSGRHASPGEAQGLARTLMVSYGWGQDQWNALRNLWMGESGWRWNALNKSSGAYGIPQSLPASKMASAGSDWRDNAATQIAWGMNYIKGRYGSPNSAYSSWLSRSPHWYDKGGWLPTGLSLAMNNTGRPERVVGPGENLGPINLYIDGQKLFTWIRNEKTKRVRRGDTF